MTEKSYAKVNIFLKILAKRGDYHELASRFVKVNTLYDSIFFEEKKVNTFTLLGDFSCPLEKNSIYKAYCLLKENKKVEEFFKNYVVRVDKKIPEFAGLGGGSSNAATFLKMLNKYCKLNLSKDYLVKLGEKIGADVPFFIYDYNSANVKGIGELVEKFDEEALNIEVFTPQIKCNTGEIFKIFREKFYKERVNKKEYEELFCLNSIEILKALNLKEANDLYEAALSLYPELQNFAKDSWYFSGSGSSFFRINNVK